ncbi:hypothetical protein HDU93_010061 [Gonapodya sp. JEL0774]|nr:hypothetical protein HDU93_010061 [Gonapodya sp. JEL0774]
MNSSGGDVHSVNDGNAVEPGAPTSDGASKRSWGIPLRVAISAMVFIDIAIIAISLTIVAVTSTRSSNADAINQGRSSITALAKGIQVSASLSVWKQMDTYLSKIELLASQTQGLVKRGIVKYDDFDSMTPHMYTNLRAIDVNIQYYMYFINTTQDMLGVGPVYDTTFAKGEINIDPGFGFHSYTLKESANGTLIVDSLYSQTAAGLQLWKRPWYIDQLPLNQYVYVDPYFTVGTNVDPVRFVQSLTYSIWDQTNTFKACGIVIFNTLNFASILEDLKASSTPNTLMYIMTGQGQILGMTGLGLLNYTGLSPLIKQSPIDNSYSLKTIFDISYNENPLFNTSARTIYAASGNALSNTVDAQYLVGDYMFQVTRYNRSGYTWLIVSGAPSSDYLADTFLLENRLADRLLSASRTVIIIAVVLVVLMSVTSFAFTEYFILKPFHFMIIVMDKAKKFDFALVRDGSLKHESVSYMTEIQNVQDHFLAMLTAFSNAIKQNRALFGGKASSTDPKSGGAFSGAGIGGVANMSNDSVSVASALSANRSGNSTAALR